MHLINGEMSYIEGNFREYLSKMQGISRQFLDDVDKIVEKYKDNAFVMSCLDELVSEILKFEENIKIESEENGLFLLRTKCYHFPSIRHTL